MAIQPHPCFEERAFGQNTDTTKLELRLKAAGGLLLDADGLSVQFPATATPNEHYFAGTYDTSIPGAIAGGILNPGLAGAVSDVFDGATYGPNAYTRAVRLSYGGSINATVLAPTSGSLGAGLRLFISGDGGVSWQSLFYAGYGSDGGGRAAYYSMPYRRTFLVLPGGSFTPKFVVAYEAAGDADFIQATFIHYEFTAHTL